MSYAVQCNACKNYAPLRGLQLPEGWVSLVDGRDICPECWARFLKWMEEER